MNLQLKWYLLNFQLENEIGLKFHIFYAHEKSHCIVPPMISWKLHLAVNSQACDFEIEYS